MDCIVFQLDKDISEVKEYPLTESDLIGDGGEGSFIDTIANYVEDSKDREDDIDWLVTRLESKGLKGLFDITKDNKGLYESITFKEGFREQYFKEALRLFKNRAKEITLSEFIENNGAYLLKKMIENERGFYQYQRQRRYCSFDSFVRTLEYNTPYYFGTTVEYHY